MTALKRSVSYFFLSPIAFHQMLEYQKRKKKIVAPTHPNRNFYTENQ
jgi:hypothetical protein